MDADALLAKLKDEGNDAPAARLARLVVDDLLSRTVEELVDPPEAAARTVRWLGAWAASDAAHERSQALADHAIAELRKRKGSIRDALPPKLVEALEDAAAHPHAPDRRLVRKVLDREPVRKLLRELLFDALVGFGEKLRSPVTENPIAKGFGGLGRIAKEQVKARTGALGALASGVYGAVSGEVERQVERRASEFADTALSGVLGKLVDSIGDPDRGEDQAALRGALLDGILELTGPELAGELERGDRASLAARARASLAAWTSSPRAAADVEEALRTVLGAELPRTLGEIVKGVGLEAEFRAEAEQEVLARLRPLVASAPFAAWLRDLVS